MKTDLTTYDVIKNLLCLDCHKIGITSSEFIYIHGEFLETDKYFNDTVAKPVKSFKIKDFLEGDVKTLFMSCHWCGARMKADIKNDASGIENLRGVFFRDD